MTEPLDLKPIKARLAAASTQDLVFEAWGDAMRPEPTDRQMIAALVAEVERLRGVAVAQWRQIESEWGSLFASMDTSDEEILRELLSPETDTA